MFNGNDHGGAPSHPKPDTKPQQQPKDAPGKPQPPLDKGENAER